MLPVLLKMVRFTFSTRVDSAQNGNKLFGRIAAYVMDADTLYEIDDELDFTVIEAILNAAKKVGNTVKIFRDIANFTVQENVSIVDALSLLNETKNRILFVVNSFEIGSGLIFRRRFRHRWSVQKTWICKRILSIANREFVYS